MSMFYQIKLSNLFSHSGNEPAHVKRVFITKARSEGSGDRAQLHSFARAFAFCSHTIVN